MARQKRIQTPGLVRHVMARGNGRMQIFLDEVDYRQFVQRLAEAVDEFSIECWNYCVMPNHYHLTLRPTLPNISAAIRNLNGGYAQWWNRRHSTVGHTFQGRFKAQIVQQDGYLAVLCRYIANNPVRAGLVKHPAEWDWSSYAATVGLRPWPEFLIADPVLRQFGDGDLHLLQQRFAAYVCGTIDDQRKEDQIRSRTVVLGDDAFRKELGEALGSDPGLTPGSPTDHSVGGQTMV